MISSPAIEDVLNNKRCVIIAIPYSEHHKDIKGIPDKLINSDNELFKDFVKLLIENKIFSVNIFLYNTDNDVEGVNTYLVKDYIRRLMVIVDEVYDAFNYVVPITAKYLFNKNAITRAVLRNQSLIDSRRTADKLDLRRKPIVFDEWLEEYARLKMKDVACCIVTPAKYFKEFSSNSVHTIEEHPCDKCMYDMIYNGFVNKDNVGKLVL